MACIFVNANRSVGTINPNIYGQFSEHLGRCIYQGIYVGQASDIPNTNGMRNDVVSALKALHVPVLRWPGGCFADTSVIVRGNFAGGIVSGTPSPIKIEDSYFVSK